MNTHAALQYVKADIAVLRVNFPELIGDEALWLDTLEGQTGINELMGQLIMLDQEAQEYAAANIVIAEAFTARARRFKARSDKLRQMIKGALRAADLPKWQGLEGSITITKPRSRCVVNDVDALPQGYFKIERKPETAAIKTALEAGEVIPGAALEYGEASIMVKIK